MCTAVQLHGLKSKSKILFLVVKFKSAEVISQTIYKVRSEDLLHISLLRNQGILIITKLAKVYFLRSSDFLRQRWEDTVSWAMRYNWFKFLSFGFFKTRFTPFARTCYKSGVTSWILQCGFPSCAPNLWSPLLQCPICIFSLFEFLKFSNFKFQIFNFLNFS